MVSKKMMYNLYMLSLRVLHGIFLYIYDTSIITFNRTFSKDKSKSLSVCFIQRICAQHKSAAMYSIFLVDKATEFCFLLCHETSVLRNDKCH